jgi:hypothetical protein
LRQLKILLTESTNRWPDVEFIGTGALGELILQSDK